MHVRPLIAVVLGAIVGGLAVLLTAAPEAPVLPRNVVRALGLAAVGAPSESRAPSIRPAEGRSATTVVVDAGVGLARSAWPGDRVDVTLTRGSAGSIRLDEILFAYTLLRNVRVIAVGQLIGGETADAPTFRMVTLEVTGAETKRLTQSQGKGWLSLSHPGEQALPHDPLSLPVVCPRLMPRDPDFPLMWPVIRRGCTEEKVRHTRPRRDPHLDGRD